MNNTAKQVNTSDECDGTCNSCSTSNECTDQKKEQYTQEQKLKLKLSKIKYKIAVMSGKGGVGKSTVTANLAVALALNGYNGKVGVLDADIHGPCIPKMLGLKGQTMKGTPDGAISPVGSTSGVKVASVDFLLPNDEAPVIWRGPLKMQLIRQFLSDIAWGDLDFLFIDLPPGTGDEPLSVVQLIPNLDGVIIVTMPSEVSEAVVKKSVSFAKQADVPIIGVVENMSGFVCPDCGAKVDIFKAGAGKRISSDPSVPFLGTIPIDPQICSDSDSGVSFTKNQSSASAKAFKEIVQKIEQFAQNNQPRGEPKQ
ncbi:MAG: Mrp/NBP35 family ATP-binding protein [Candidatus Bathyarchaeota archaeon]|nr:Mrp/NBP35 family ATP-binding protein [Candidatus Bathyarchaeota archaeon]